MMTSTSARAPRALILAAGRGKRLDGLHAGPKALLEFGGRSLMRRHLETLAGCGVTDITIVTGYEEDLLRAHVGAIDQAVEFVSNPDYSQGSLVSLDCGRAVLQSGDPVLLMDADVLHEPAILRRLIDSRHDGCFLVDRDIEPGDEPVKLCIAAGRIVDFAKAPTRPYEWHGESVGFFRFSPALANELAADMRARLQGDDADRARLLEYEPVLRDMVAADTEDRFGFEDVTGLAWTEIDFPIDVERARALLGRVDGV